MRKSPYFFFFLYTQDEIHSNATYIDWLIHIFFIIYKFIYISTHKLFFIFFVLIFFFSCSPLYAIQKLLFVHFVFFFFLILIYLFFLLLWPSFFMWIHYVKSSWPKLVNIHVLFCLLLLLFFGFFFSFSL